mgnify:CR=1 FL=1
MIVVLKQNPNRHQLESLIAWLQEKGIIIHTSIGEANTILGLVGDTTAVDMDKISINPHVERVMRVQEPYKKANRKFHPEDTVVDVCGVPVGGGHFTVIAGPCSVETEEQITYVAQQVKKAGAAFLRGGAFKPRTSPYDFQGLGEEGIRLLLEAKKATGLPIVTELMDIRNLPLFEQVDVIQVGARNMQNFQLLKAVGKMKKPVLLKRGLANTIEEWIMSAEYIMAGGNENVIFCERGIRTFEKYTRNTLDISAVPVIRAKSHLPILIDPSHATGVRAYIEPISKAAVAVGADGLIVEVHPCPSCALSDGPQSLTFEQFEQLTENLKPYAALAGRIF